MKDGNGQEASENQFMNQFNTLDKTQETQNYDKLSDEQKRMIEKKRKELIDNMKKINEMQMKIDMMKAGMNLPNFGIQPQFN